MISPRYIPEQYNRSSPLTLEAVHIGAGRPSSLPTEREVFVLQNLAAQHEEKAEKLYLKLYTLEFNNLPNWEVCRRLTRDFKQTTEMIEAVNKRVALACSGKLPAKETIQSIVQVMSAIDTWVRQIDGEMYLRHTSKPLAPVPLEVICAILRQARSEGKESNREPCPRAHQTQVGSARPQAGFWGRLCKQIIFGRNMRSGITGWDFWQSF
ncbi:unnamed protein product [Tuber aestivum]|uniref:Uncharacterized protein n=1 Tax=Tuber aestivum TaxID=59557 RepID=A0A292PP69_9PEZI|nr:unnamed protein product [Tuber aestivum]